MDSITFGQGVLEEREMPVGIDQSIFFALQRIKDNSECSYAREIAADALYKLSPSE